MTSPTDAAWDVLQEGHRVEKILPALAIPALMGAYGAYQGYKNVKDNRVTDPVLGVVGTEGDDSFASNALEFGTGFAQGTGGGVGATAKLGGKLGAKIFGRKAAKQAAKQAAAQNAARYAAERNAGKAIGTIPEGQIAAANARRMFNRTGVASPTLGSLTGAGSNATRQAQFRLAAQQSPYALSMGRQAARQAGRTGALGRAGTQAGLRGSQAVANNARNIGRVYALQNAGLDPALALLAAGGSLLQNNPTDPPQMTGMSPGYAGAGAGASGTGGYQLDQAGGGIGGVQNVGVGQGARQDIWNDVNWNQQQPDPYADVQWQDPNSRASSQKLTGEYMDLGEFLLKSAINDMERKASCPSCGKMQKMCGCEKKAEDKSSDKKKKPAHGMVIVIGSGKAGPGPSTEGKRDKKKD
jgi:hypothetical protein